MSNADSKPTESTFCQIMKPIYWVSKSTGLWPQSFIQSSPGVTVLDIGYIIFIYVLFGYLIAINMSAKLWDYYMTPFGSEILRYGLQTHLVNGLCLGVLIITTNVVQYRRKWEYMSLLDAITKVVEQEFHVKNPVRVVQLFIAFIIFWENAYLLLVLSGYYFLIDRTLNIRTSYLYTSYYIMNVSMLALINEYTYFIVHIRRLMTIVNRLLKQLLLNDAESELILLDKGRKAKTPTIAYDEIFTIYGQIGKDFANGGSQMKPNKATKTFVVPPASAGFNKFSPMTVYNTFVTQLKIDGESSMDSILKSLNRLSVLHYHLCDAIRLVNRISSLPMMLQFGAIFVFLVFGLFTIYKAFNSGTWAFKIMAVANASWIAFYLVAILTVITATSSATTAGRATGDIIHQIIRKHQNHFTSDVIERLSTMSLQIKMREMSFSCGLFQFDWQLFSSILSACAMYLVFLIQFDVTPPLGLSSSNLTLPSIEIFNIPTDGE
ncbi:uncharacterized protein LOC131215579 [Anopheles bellator]|uniref:uncharacterized protein LOC131215579 n=1 Tax=Anopheles bellator TaxID=139047 RepID=UPI002647E3B3|nr:uncharacterized protein LOC131215579 [Anopheles bellator]